MKKKNSFRPHDDEGFKKTKRPLKDKSAKNLKRNIYQEIEEEEDIQWDDWKKDNEDEDDEDEDDFEDDEEDGM